MMRHPVMNHAGYIRAMSALGIARPTVEKSTREDYINYYSRCRLRYNSGMDDDEILATLARFGIGPDSPPCSDEDYPTGLPLGFTPDNDYDVEAVTAMCAEIWDWAKLNHSTDPEALTCYREILKWRTM